MYKTNVLTFMLWLMTTGESWCAQVFSRNSVSFSRHLDSSGQFFFWSRWLALSLSLSLSLSFSLSLSLSLCLSVCLSVCLYLTHSNSVTVSLSLSISISLSLSLSLPHLPLVLSSRIDICLHARKNTCQNCYSRTVKQLQAHHGRE